MDNQNKLISFKDVSYYEQTLESIKQNMESLGTYKPEFDRVIEIYAQLYVEYMEIGRQWKGTGYKIVESHTNKAGATNKTTAPIYKALQQVREQMHYYETCLGLTPAALKKINDKLDNNGNKTSKLEEILQKIEQNNGL